MEELLKLPQRDPSLPLMTLEELGQHKGDSSTRYICVKGVIFDVTKNEVYGPNGGYKAFCGYDSTVSLAKMNFNKENFDRSQMYWKKDLTKEEMKNA